MNDSISPTTHGLDEAIFSRNTFPGRSTLYVHEVAEAFSVSVQHVITLIMEGLLVGKVANPSKKPTSRDHWRVTATEYDAYILRRNSTVRKPRARRRKVASGTSARGEGTPRAVTRFCKGAAAKCKGTAAVQKV